MQETDPSHDRPSDPAAAVTCSRRRRLIAVSFLLLTILLLAFIPPLVNVSRFQRRIARNIGASLGRPVHFDRVSLSLLPLPGFTLEDFVVEENPAFGSEPFIRAKTVQATIRISSLWRRRAEFSRISLTEPTSINLVHTADGKWNIENLLVQASRIEAAPTAQRFAGPAPRFPYIEATGARLNLKLDQVKTPFSLNDADFALWLPEPHQWHLRLEAHPVRTNASPGDTGTLRVEGTLGGTDTPAGALAASLAQVPIDLHGDWRDAQLGGLSRLLLGRDAGLRGDLSLTVGVLGTIGQSVIATDIKLSKARRADFVPVHPLDLEANCTGTAENSFHAFSSIVCHWPSLGSANRSILIVAADLPDIYHPRSASAMFTLPALPAANLLDLLSVATPHPPTGLLTTGTLAGTLAWNRSNSAQPVPQTPDLQTRPRSPTRLREPPLPPQSAWSGEVEFSGESLQIPGLGPNPLPLGDITLRSSPPVPPQSGRSHGRSQPGTSPAPGFDLLPITLPLGGRQPATLEGHFDASGYTLHLSGAAIPARLLALGDAVPQLGDGLHQLLDPTPATPPSETGMTTEAVIPSGARSAQSKDLDGVRASTTPGPLQPNSPSTEPPAEDASPTPIHIDLTATRAWGAPQIWRQTTPTPSHRPTRK